MTWLCLINCLAFMSDYFLYQHLPLYSHRSAALSLPAGRHVLKFNMSAPLGYYVNLVSTTEFTFGDEEEVMPKLRAVSLTCNSLWCRMKNVGYNVYNVYNMINILL